MFSSVPLHTPSVFCKHILEGAGTLDPCPILTCQHARAVRKGNLYAPALVLRAAVPAKEDALRICQHSSAVTLACGLLETGV